MHNDCGNGAQSVYTVIKPKIGTDAKKNSRGPDCLQSLHVKWDQEQELFINNAPIVTSPWTKTGTDCRFHMEEGFRGAELPWSLQSL